MRSTEVDSHLHLRRSRVRTHSGFGSRDLVTSRAVRHVQLFELATLVDSLYSTTFD
jgi:hypothetical protein